MKPEHEGRWVSAAYFVWGVARIVAMLWALQLVGQTNFWAGVVQGVCVAFALNTSLRRPDAR